MSAPLSGRVTQGSFLEGLFVRALGAEGAFADAAGAGALVEVGLRKTGVEPTVGVTRRAPTGFDLELSW